MSDGAEAIFKIQLWPCRTRVASAPVLLALQPTIACQQCPEIYFQFQRVTIVTGTITSLVGVPVNFRKE